jgi:tetratricopeptide (TPR) repeat protein
VKTPQFIQRHSFGLSHALFVGILLLRLFALARLSASPFLLPPRGDMYFYNDWAQRILHGDLSDHLAFYGLPGYPYLLAFLYKIFGYNPFIPGFLQVLLDSGTALLIYRITLRVLPKEERLSLTTPSIGTWRFVLVREGEAVAAVAALGWAFFVPTQAYSVILMPTAWFVFAFWFVVWRIVRKDAAPNWKECLLLGLLIGITATAVATILFLVPLVLAALFLKSKIDNGQVWRRAAAGGALLLFGLLAGTSPCWIHNYFIARDPVFLSAHSGINFWIGNNPEANGYPRFPPGLGAGQAALLEDSISAAESAAGRPLKRSEVSAYWSDKTSNYIAHHPDEWLKLLLIKLRNFWSAFQYDDLSIITSLREEHVILPGLYFGIVAAFALPGILLAVRISVLSRWVAAAILLHMTALLPVFVTERYRLAVVPGLLIFAAIGLSLFWRSLIARAYGQVALYLFLLLASTMFVSWPQRNPALWALDAYNSGWQALEAGNLARAEKKLALARSYVPANPETNFALGNLKLAQGKREAASSFYVATLTFDQGHRGALNNLGVMALEDHNYDAAETWFRRALLVEPRNAKTHFLLAKILWAEGRREGAQREIDFALQLEPKRREFNELKQELTSDSQP